jgi:hypothetical protein
VWRLWHCGWRWETEPNESTLEPVNKALPAELLYIEKTILASAGGPTMLPSETKGVEAEEANWHCG